MHGNRFRSSHTGILEEQNKENVKETIFKDKIVEDFSKLKTRPQIKKCKYRARYIILNILVLNTTYWNWIAPSTKIKNLKEVEAQTLGRGKSKCKDPKIIKRLVWSWVVLLKVWSTNSVLLVHDDKSIQLK